MDTYSAIASGVSAVNIVLLLGLIYLYVRMFTKTHAGYTFGLTLFSSMLLAQNSGMVYVCGFLTEYYNWQLSPYFALVAILEFVGLAVLLKVTL